MPKAVVRCDLIIPVNLNNYVTVKALLDVLQSTSLRKEIDALAGYDSSVTGNTIAEL